MKVSAKAIKEPTEASAESFQQTFSSHKPNPKPTQKKIRRDINKNQPKPFSMDFHLKQWRNQHESEEQQPYSSAAAKIPKIEPHQTQTQPEPASGYALPLFVPEPNTKVISSLSAFSESTTPASATRFPSKIFSFSTFLVYDRHKPGKWESFLTVLVGVNLIIIVLYDLFLGSVLFF